MIIKPSWGQNQPSEPSQDAVNGVVSGKDHSTGSAIVTVTGARSPILSNDGSGGRVGSSVTLRVISASSGGRTAQITGFSSSSGTKKVITSITTRSITNPSALKPECTNSPAPPKKDPPEDDPEEPGKPPQGDGPIPPPIPAPSAEPPTTGNPGCEPTSNTKWFNGSCPPGTQSLGSATLADGTVRSLCKGPSRKPDGCDQPSRWICDSTIGNCIKSSTGGGYDSYEACMGAGCKRLRFSCVDGSCVEKEGGEFPTYDACMSSGCQVNGFTVVIIQNSVINGRDEGCGVLDLCYNKIVLNGYVPRARISTSISTPWSGCPGGYHLTSNVLVDGNIVLSLGPAGVNKPPTVLSVTHTTTPDNLVFDHPVDVCIPRAG